MKFKDKDGNVFEDIMEAKYKYCRTKSYRNFRCSESCVFEQRSDISDCTKYCIISPAEAARLMGYEVVEEANMDKQKPPDQWTLGEVKKYCKNYRGRCRECKFITPYMKCHISGVLPADWDLTEPPRFTEEEVADARALIRLHGDGELYRVGGETFPVKSVFIRIKDCHARLRDGLFPSIIQSGQSVKLSEIVGGGT